MKKTILFLCLCYLVGVTYAQEPFRVMFYNVENLFDCQHDTLKNDYELFPIWWGFVKWKMIIA